MMKLRWISFKVFNGGSRLQLICILKLATAKPDYIFWWDFDEDDDGGDDDYGDDGDSDYEYEF